MSARTRAEPCLSDFAVDSLLAGDLSGAQEGNARAHAAACEACTARIARTTRERDVFMNEAAPLALDGKRRALAMPVGAQALRRFPAARVGAASAMVALAAAVLLFVGLRRGEDPSGERTKGHGRLGVVVKHGDSTRISAPEDVVAPGDHIRFRYTSREPKHLAILGIDGAGRASIYVPHAPGEPHSPGEPDEPNTPGARVMLRAERVEPGVDVALATTLELDDAPGTETFYALFCDSPVLLEPLRRALEARPGAPPSTSCAVDRVALRKEGRR